jgi:hypothetical protein
VRQYVFPSRSPRYTGLRSLRAPRDLQPFGDLKPAGVDGNHAVPRFTGADAPGAQLLDLLLDLVEGVLGRAVVVVRFVV